MHDQTIAAVVSAQTATDNLGRRLTAAADAIDELSEQAGSDLAAAGARLADSVVRFKATLTRVRNEALALLADLASFADDFADSLEPPPIPAGLVGQLVDAPWDLELDEEVHANGDGTLTVRDRMTGETTTIRTASDDAGKVAAEARKDARHPAGDQILTAVTNGVPTTDVKGEEEIPPPPPCPAELSSIDGPTLGELAQEATARDTRRPGSRKGKKKS